MPRRGRGKRKAVADVAMMMDEASQESDMGIPIMMEDDGEEPPKRSSSRYKKHRAGAAAAELAGVPAAAAAAASSSGSAWSCAACTFRNAGGSSCSVCGSAKSTSAASPKKEMNWVCAACTVRNAASRSKCECCGMEKSVTGSDDMEDEGEIDAEIDLTAPVVVAAPRSPARKPEIRLEDNMIFLAGVEESFGSVHLHPHLIRLIARFVRKPWDLLCSKFGHPLSNESLPQFLQPPVKPESSTSSSSSSSTFAAEARRMASIAKAHANAALFEDFEKKLAVPLDTFRAMQKSIVTEACNKAMKLAHQMTTIFRVMEFEREERSKAQCFLCNAKDHHSNKGGLQFSDNCHETGEWLNSSGVSQKHFICLECANKHVMSLVNSRRCHKVTCPFPRCDKEVPLQYIKNCLTKEEFTAYSDMCFSISTSDSNQYLKCPSCDALTEIVVINHSELRVPKGGITVTDDSGKVLSEDSWRHYSEFRLRCHACNTNFCTSCKSTPYHLGFNCEQFKSYQKATHCRFCTEAIEPGKSTPTTNGLDVCRTAACVAFQKKACTTKLECGHACYGLLGEDEHPPCLDEKCNDEVGSDLCGICFVEELRCAGPVVKLTSCGHLFHEKCVVEKIKRGKPGTRHTFGFLDCPMCKKRIDHPSAEIQKVLKPALELYEQVALKAEARLTIEGMLKDDKLINPTSRFYKNPREYALSSFAFYNCYKCRKFFFGGRRDCEQNAAAEVRPDNEFVCFDCADLKSSKCKKAAHAEFQLWKCRFCCSPAVWFCFGTTHFCDPCHGKAGAVMKVPREKTKQCPGVARCQIKGNHAPNGPDKDCEFNLGCGACTQKNDKVMEERRKEEKVNELLEKEGAAKLAAAKVK